MALKRKITKADYDALPEALRGEYKADGMDFVLDVEGIEDPAELKRAKDREKQRADEEAAKARKALEDLAALKQQLEDDGTLTARKKGDIEALERSWQAKIDKAEGDAKAAVGKLQSAYRSIARDGTAAALAKELAGDNAPILLPHIQARLDVDFSGDEPTFRILGPDGKPSAMKDVSELKQEFVANPNFAAIIIGSKASGGGANGGKQGGGGATKKLSEMGDAERTAFQKNDPQGFDKAVAAEQSVAPVKL